MKILKDISLLPYNTFGIDVKTHYFIEYSTVDELKYLLDTELFKTYSFLHIGGGSNLLFTADFKGIILHSANKQISIVNENNNEVLIEVSSGVVWDDFVAFCVENNYCGVENLTDIPGETGAAAVQNIGAYGVEVKDVIQTVNTVDTLNLQFRLFNNDECEYGYRSSIFKHKYPGRFIITSVLFKLSKIQNFNLNYNQLGEAVKNIGEVNLQNIRKAVSEIRGSKLPNPKVHGNAGSFFMNPVVDNEKFTQLFNEYEQLPYYRINNNDVKIPAAWLIEQCGWKGKHHGNAAVHPNHALVIINTGNAQAREIVKLASEIIKSVQSKFGIVLKPEVIFV